MDRAHDRDEKRLWELLTDRAVFGLEQDEAQELASLLAHVPDGDPESMERVVATVALAGTPGRFPPLPARLRARIRASAGTGLRQSGQPAEGDSATQAKARCRDEGHTTSNRIQPGTTHEPAQ